MQPRLSRRPGHFFPGPSRWHHSAGHGRGAEPRSVIVTWQAVLFYRRADDGRLDPRLGLCDSIPYTRGYHGARAYHGGNDARGRRLSCSALVTFQFLCASACLFCHGSRDSIPCWWGICAVRSGELRCSAVCPSTDTVHKYIILYITLELRRWEAVWNI